MLLSKLWWNCYYKLYIHKSTQNAKTTTKPNTSDAPTTLFVFKHMCLCTDIRQPNLGVKIIYLLCCTLVYWLFATLGNCFSALDMQNADTRVTETLSFCHRNLQKCSLIIKKSSLFSFFWKISNWWWRWLVPSVHFKEQLVSKEHRFFGWKPFNVPHLKSPQAPRELVERAEKQQCCKMFLSMITSAFHF